MAAQAAAWKDPMCTMGRRFWLTIAAEDRLVDCWDGLPREPVANIADTRFVGTKNKPPRGHLSRKAHPTSIRTEDLSSIVGTGHVMMSWTLSSTSLGMVKDVTDRCRRPPTVDWPDIADRVRPTVARVSPERDPRAAPCHVGEKHSQACQQWEPQKWNNQE